MLTVIFASHNGAKTLPLMLPALEQLEEPSGGWRLIAVDNGSDDQTRALLESYEERLPLQVVFEPKRGKNAALNAALSYVDGDLVVFTDDDVVPQTDWLCQMRTVADEQPEFSIFGGSIVPRWPDSRPEWLDHMPRAILYAETPERFKDGPNESGPPWGPNMAIRAKVFEDGYQFDESVGPQSGQYRMGSETELVDRLRKRGYKSWFCRDSVVEHIVRAHQIELDWVLARAYRAGRGASYRKQYHMADGATGNPTMLFGSPPWIYRALLSSYCRALMVKIKCRRNDWILNRWQVNYWRGYIREGLSQRFGREGLAGGR